MSNRAASLTAKYDDFSDVLYMAISKPRDGVTYLETDEGLLLRVGPDGHAVGVTVEDYLYVWKARLDELAGFIALNLDVDAEMVRARLPSGHTTH